MRARVLVLSSLVATSAAAIGRTAPLLLIPADGSPIKVAAGPGNIAIGDLDKDSRPDLVVASAQSRTVTILSGRGDGRFTSVRAIAVAENPTEMVLRDVNGDANLDLALASHDSYAVTLLLGDGRGGFAPAPISPIVMKKGRQPHTHGLDAADFNRDGNVDLVTVNSNDDNDVSLVFGDGKGGFTPAPDSPFAVARAPYPLALGDLNADGRMDMVVTSTGIGAEGTTESASSAPLTALFGEDQGRFRRAGIPLRTSRTWFVEMADLNGDRKLDLVATHTENRLLSVLLGDGTGRFREAPRSPFDLGQNAWAVRLADLNGDGRPDVVAAAGIGVGVLLGDGRGTFTPAPGSPFAVGPGTWKLVVGDVNADGRPDVATSNLEAGTVTVLLNGQGIIR